LSSSSSAYSGIQPNHETMLFTGDLNNNNIADTNPTANNDNNVIPAMRYAGLLKIWRRSCVFFISYFTPTTIAIAIVVGIDWNSSCDSPLREWAVVQAVLQTVMLTLSLHILRKLPSAEDTPEVQEQRIRSIFVFYVFDRLLDFVWFGWFVLGMGWTFSASCESTAPHLYKLCFTMIVIQFCLIFIIVFFIFCCCLCIILRVQMPSAAPEGATRRMLAALRREKFKENSTIPHESANCGICLSEYQYGEELRTLPCKHHFHTECVDKWLVLHKSCPFCKRVIDRPVNA